ncbi:MULTISPECIES: osmoprotectant NAGGN system M42 family peptidase [unclassified Iodidimonas]|jgi:peptidase M42 family hydrolase|nr:MULTISPECIES: osmoprotectant NAGGN system M42 family peptidase [unclassified Iodidimonas]
MTIKRPTIDISYLEQILLRLLAIPSPTGYTDEIVRFCAQELKSLGLDYELTRRGAIRAWIKGKAKHPGRAIIAHLDTLGAQVKNLKDNGRLEIVPIGHWSARFAEGARCNIFTTKGSWRGTILPLKASGHTFNEEIDQQPSAWSNLEVRVDGLCFSKNDLMRAGIAIGDFVAIDPMPELVNGFINSRHLDDKAGVASMFAAIKALVDDPCDLPVDSYFLFSIAEEVGIGASTILHGDIASMVSIDNGTTAPGQNSREFGVTIAMADQSGPFDYHLTQKLLALCEQHDIRHQRDIFRYYRSDSASALEAGNDIRTALITFGIDASHGWERIHSHALRSIAELVGVYLQSEVHIERDKDQLSGLKGFTHQPITPSKKEAADGFPSDD